MERMRLEWMGPMPKKDWRDFWEVVRGNRERGRR